MTAAASNQLDTHSKPPTRRGWCPGALAPMQSGDGLIVRVRPHTGALSLKEMRSIAECAHKYGNGIVELTRRANVQIRGIEDNALSDVHAMLHACNLLDQSDAQESIRNVMVSPLSGLDPDECADVRDIARALEDRLSANQDLWSLPAKFGFILDSGASPGFDNERADIHLRATCDTSGKPTITLGLDRADGPSWIAATHERDPQKIADALTTIALTALNKIADMGGATRRIRDLPETSIDQIRKTASPVFSLSNDADTCVAAPMETQRPLGLIEFDEAPPVLALAAPFGSTEASSWHTLLDVAETAGITEIRLSPWRTIYLPLAAHECAAPIIAAAHTAGFITTAGDPILRIDACPGAPACSSAMSDTRADARAIAAKLANRTEIKSVHVSGCAKGCARSKPADIILVACPQGYGIAKNATAATSAEFVVPQCDAALIVEQHKQARPTPSRKAKMSGVPLRA